MALVLIVDDSEMDRRLAGRLLESDPVLQIAYATDGAKALESIEKQEPELVITDLQMPHMDGLELVNHLHVRYPRVPVILMTAHGSETIASQALERGAASYVPKSQLAYKLHETVQDILALARANRTYERLIECSTRSQFEFQLNNDVALVDPLVDLVQQMIASMGICGPSEQLQVGVALEQAIQNAIYHGNLELTAEESRLPRPQREALVAERRAAAPYSERHVFVQVAITRDEARFVLQDQGAGFDVANVVPREGVVDQEGRRGLVLIRSFMDEIRFNDRGNELTMIKRRKST